MSAHADKIQEHKNNSQVSEPAQKPGSSGLVHQLADNRPETIAQRKLAEIANNSPHVNQLAQLKSKNSADPVSQAPIQRKENNTGLPDQLKSGVESLSGQSMDDVKVHSNSDKPAQLNAHAYAQGTDIHLAPGQEKHLPHEAWHVVQQKEGRVKPTKQLKSDVAINDDHGLEKEADVMGTQALSPAIQAKSDGTNTPLQNTSSKTIQRSENPPIAKDGGITKSFKATVEQDLIILRGDTSFWGNLTGSRFTQLHGLVEQLTKANEDAKPTIIDQILTLGEDYLANHKHDGSENDNIRKASIQKIVNGIKRFNNDSSAAAEKLSIASTDDKVGLGSKLKKAFFGDDTPFVQAVNAFTHYQNQISSVQTDQSEEGINFLSSVFDNAQLVKEKVDQWQGIHAKNPSTSEDANGKRDIIKKMVEKLGVININLQFKYKNLFKFSGDTVKIDPLKKSLVIAESVKVKLLHDVPEKLQYLEAEAKGVTYKDKAFDFAEISLTKPPSELKAFSCFTITTPSSIVLKKNDELYTLIVGESSLNIKAGNLFEGDAKASGVFQYSSGQSDNLKLIKEMDIPTIKVALKDGIPAPVKNFTAEAEGLKIKAAGDSHDVNFSKISLTADSEKFSLIPNVSFTSPNSIEILKKSNGFIITVLNAGVNIENNWFNASATASGTFDYESGSTAVLKSDIRIPTATGKVGTSAPAILQGIEGEVKDLVIRSGFHGEEESSNGIDWKQITISKPPTNYNPFGDRLSVTPPNKAVILGKAEDYKTTFEGTKAEASLGDSIKAEGKVTFSLDRNGDFNIEQAGLTINADLPKISEDIDSPPLEITFLPVPISAGISFRAGIEAQGKLKGKIEYEKGELVISGESKIVAELFAAIRAHAGIGSSYLIYAGVFAEARASGIADGSTTLIGKFTKPNRTYELDSAELNYDFKTVLKATISAGAEARALGFIQKTLYEVKGAEWIIGESESKGTYNIKSPNESVTKQGKGPHSGNLDKVNSNIETGQDPKSDSLTKNQDLISILKTLQTVQKQISESKDPKSKEVTDNLAHIHHQLHLLHARMEKAKPGLFSFSSTKEKYAKVLGYMDDLSIQIPEITHSLMVTDSNSELTETTNEKSLEAVKDSRKTAVQLFEAVTAYMS